MLLQVFFINILRLYLLWKKEEKAGVNDYVGMIIAFVLLCFLLVPALTEILMVWWQSQELEQVTKAAAEKACALQSSSLNRNELDNQDYGSANYQGDFGALLNIDQTYKQKMYPAVWSTFKMLAKNPSTYAFENIVTDKTTCRDGQCTATNQMPILELFDMLGNPIATNRNDPGDYRNNIEGINPGKPTDSNPYASIGSGYMGASPSLSICPIDAAPQPEQILYNGQRISAVNPAWCLNANPEDIDRSFVIDKVRTLDSSIQTNGKVSQDYFNKVDNKSQARASYNISVAMGNGKCLPNDDEATCNARAVGALRGQLDKCVVCAFKRVKHIFYTDGFHAIQIDQVLSPTIYKCAEASFKYTNSSHEYSEALKKRFGHNGIESVKHAHFHEPSRADISNNFSGRIVPKATRKGVQGVDSFSEINPNFFDIKDDHVDVLHVGCGSPCPTSHNAKCPDNCQCNGTICAP